VGIPDGRALAASSPARALLLVGAVPTALTLALEWSGVWSGSNAWRAAAGVPLGAAVALVAAKLNYDEWEKRRPIVRDRPPTPI